METHFSGEIILDFCKDRVIKFLAWEKTGEDFAILTPWKQLEEEILFELQKPLLIFREQGVSGEIFDNDTGDAFVNEMPMDNLKKEDYDALM